MRYASKKEEQKGILPVMNPLFNLREICKQSSLLEDHLNNPRKRCPDCIRKHFMTIEAFYEEAISIDKDYKYNEYLDGKAEMMRELQAEWLDAKDTKSYHDTCNNISQRLRVIRKEYAPLCFDIRKMASLDARCYFCKTATLSVSEKEEREVERLVRKKPTKKPPRQDLRRNRMNNEDKDLEGLSRGENGDRDLTMRSNKAASLSLWAIRQASKKKNLRNDVIKKFKADPKKKYRTEEGGEVSFNTAWSRPDTTEYAQAERDVDSAVKSVEKKQKSEKKQKKDKLVNLGVLTKEEKERRQNLVNGAKDSLAADPANMFNFFNKGSGDIDRDGALDILVEMTMAEGFPAEDFGMPRIGAGKELKEKLSQEKDRDRRKVTKGLITQEQFEENERARSEAVEIAINKAKELRKKDLADILKGAEFPFDKKKEKKRRECSKFSKLILKNKVALNNPKSQKDPKFLSSLASSLKKELKLKIPENPSREDIAKSISDWAEENDISPKDVFDKTNPFGEVISLSEQASVESSSLEEELKKEAVDLIDNPTFAQLELIENTPALKLLVALRKSNPSSVETEETKKKDPKVLEKSYNRTVAQIRNLIRNKNVGGAFGKYSDNERKGLNDALQLLEEIPSLTSDQVPKDYLEGIAKGYDDASAEFKKLFSSTGKSMGAIIAELSKKSDELWEGDLKDKEGVDLGRALAAATMTSAYADNFDFNLTSSDSMVSVTRDSAGRERVVPDKKAISNQIAEQVDRFLTDDTGRRERALAYYDEKLSSSSLSKADRIKYESAKEGVVVSMIMSGDTSEIANQRAPVDPFFIEQAKTSKSALAYEMISEASQLNKGYTPAQVRSKQKEFLNSLEDKDFANAVGGENGPFAPLLELLEPAYCPDNPLNGSKAGQKLPPGEECPFPLSSEMKSLLRDHISDVSIDHYTVVPSAEREFKDHSKDNNKKVQGELARFLKKNKDEYTKILLNPNSSKKEEALAFLFLQMKEANLKDLKIGDFSDPITGNQAKIDSARKEAILKLIKNGDKTNIKKLLEDVEKAVGTPVLEDSSDFNFKWGSKNFYDKSFIHRRILSDPQGATLMRKTSTYIDYQQRAQSFKRGMRVYPFLLGKGERSGVVVQVFPAIGMVDVEFPHGTARYPVEELVLDSSQDVVNLTGLSDSVPGGVGVVPVSAGPSAKKVASLYLRNMRRVK